MKKSLICFVCFISMVVNSICLANPVFFPSGPIKNEAKELVDKLQTQLMVEYALIGLFAILIVLLVIMIIIKLKKKK